MNLRCKDCKVTFDSSYNKDCPFCGSDAFVVELLHANKETEPDYWMIRGEIWSDDIAFLEAHNGTSSEVQAAMDEWENYAVPLYKSPVTTDKLSVEKLKSDNETMETALVKIELALRPPLGREKEVFQAGEIQFNDNVRLFAERALAKVRGNNEYTTEK